MKKQLLIRGITISVIFIWGIGSLIYLMIDAQQVSSNISIPEYNALFKKEISNDMKVLATVKSKNREPVSTYIYNGRFNISVYRVILNKDLSLNKMIFYENEFSNKSIIAAYGGLPSLNFDMSIRVNKSDKVKSIHFQSDGDTMISNFKSDSLYCYYLKFRSFSIYYNNEPYDVIANADVSNVPASVVFKKEGQFLYVVLMTKRQEGEKMEPDQLFRMINK